MLGIAKVGIPGQPMNLKQPGHVDHARRAENFLRVEIKGMHQKAFRLNRSPAFQLQAHCHAPPPFANFLFDRL